LCLCYLLLLGLFLCCSDFSWGGGGSASLRNGLTVFWEFSDSTNITRATVGTDMGIYNPGKFAWVLGGLGGAVYVDRSAWLIVTHNIPPGTGGGSRVNEWSILMDIMVPQSSMGNWVALYQTNPSNTNDGDFFVKNNPAGQIGVAATGYSTNTISGDTWYRVVVSVDNGSFYRIYVNGSQWLEGNVQAIDGRFSLDPTLLIFADEDGEDYPKYCSTLAMWNRPLTGAEIASMGNAYTVIVPEHCVEITESGGNTAVKEGGTADSYETVLCSNPTADVWITAVPSDGQIDLGQGPGLPVVLNFTTSNWNIPQTVTVTAVDDDVYEGKSPHTTAITHTAISTDENYNAIVIASVDVSVTDDELTCGDWGYLRSDLNRDCYVDLVDFAIFAQQWLEIGSD
jgi:hypothetical protein